ncbi:lysylphosphatidylglycerol synthase transmembrane domain-containing protein [Szabonella alba]|uniref:Flippase-like domain-containing protein n=1 Tax=Szabonella alba TaxID=2804194 RepID=A0A8K0Y2U0_9RHOB|nr:lysylphosphatidylglycerol synthase transmembrane domain-containing protein [Szabonella alba]MBL4919249.1 flippase-like domain-containing protein [Szabonella alba]
MARVGLVFATRLMLAVGLCALVWHLAGGDAAATALITADPVWLVAAAFALTLQTCACAARWQVTAAGLGITLPRSEALREYYLSQLVNQLLPGGVLGDAGRAMRTRGAAGLMASGQAVVFERLAGQLALLAVLGVAFAATLWAPGGLDWPVWVMQPLLWAAAAALILVTGLWALRGRLPAALRAQGGAFARAVAARGVLRQQLLLSVVAALCNIAAFGFCAWAVGAPLSLPAMLALVPLILLAMVIPLTIAGWGLREGAAVALLPLAGVSTGDALATSIAFGLIFLASTLLGGAALATVPSRLTMKP